jgi:CheY-like chemotaxis protein
LPRYQTRLVKPISQPQLQAILSGILAGISSEPDSRGAEPHTQHLESPQQLRILVAEDNPVNAAFLRNLLQKRGHQVTVAENGHRAVEIWQRGECDLILMDVQMPELDGLAATRAIRQEETTTGSHVPIVALTAQATAGDRQTCREAGMDDYLPKPVDKEQLMQVLHRLTERSPTPDPSLSAASC